MSESVCIFEDKKFSNFFPLSLSQPVFELRIGFQNFRLRLLDEISPPSDSILCREYIAPVMQTRYPDLTINQLPKIPDAAGGSEDGPGAITFINGRILCYEDELKKLLDAIPVNGIGIKGGYVVAARLERSQAADFAEYIKKRISEDAISRLCDELKSYMKNKPSKATPKPIEKLIIPASPDEGTFEDDHELGQDSLLEKLPRELTALIEKHGIKIVNMHDARLLSFPWQIIEENSKAIEDDFLKLPFRGQAEESIVFTGVQMVADENIVIGEAVVVKPGVVLDASAGPIVIGDGTMVMANSTLAGPVYVGKQCFIKPGSKILEGTSIGDVCKIGGEVEGTIFAAYTNKQHDGFMGHAYIGEWVNIGAGTNNSDLKNNYSPVRMWCAGTIRQTSRQFLGLIMGDHTKTGINTMFNTGTVIGFNCNVFGSDPLDKFVPSFAWGTSGELGVYELEKGMQTAEVVMERRNVKFDSAYKNLFRKLFEISQRCSRNI